MENFANAILGGYGAVDGGAINWLNEINEKLMPTGGQADGAIEQCQKNTPISAGYTDEDYWKSVMAYITTTKPVL